MDGDLEADSKKKDGRVKKDNTAKLKLDLWVRYLLLFPNSLFPKFVPAHVPESAHLNGVHAGKIQQVLLLILGCISRNVCIPLGFF